MTSYTFENNKRGPFSPHKGSTFNAKCPTCGTPTWYCEDPGMTLCVGYQFFDYERNIVGVLDLEGRVYCKECYPRKEERR